MWPVHLCLFWIWERIIIHFLCKSSTTPSLAAQAIHKWFLIDWTHFKNILQDTFWLALISFFLMFLTKYLTLNWWLVPGSFSIIYLSIWVWCSPIIYVGIIYSTLNICNVLIYPFFPFDWNQQIQKLESWTELQFF